MEQLKKGVFANLLTMKLANNKKTNLDKNEIEKKEKRAKNKLIKDLKEQVKEKRKEYKILDKRFEKLNKSEIEKRKQLAREIEQLMEKIRELEGKEESKPKEDKPQKLSMDILYDEKGYLNKERKKLFDIYNNKDTSEREKKKIRETYKDFEIINNYVNIVKIKPFDANDEIEQIELENLKKDFIFGLCDQKKHHRKPQKINKEYVKKYVKRKVKQTKTKYFNDENYENIFGRSENYEIKYTNSYNTKYIIEQIENNERLLANTMKWNIANEHENKLDTMRLLLDKKEQNNSRYKMNNTTTKDKINQIYNDIVNQSERIWRKYVERTKEPKESTREIILGIYGKEIKDIESLEKLKLEQYEIWNNHNTRICQKMKDLKEYFIENYKDFYVDYLFNSISNKYKRGFVGIL